MNTKRRSLRDDHGSDHAEDDHSHAPGAVNEHVFYNLTVVGQVADSIADALSEKDSANTQYFRDNAAAFNEQIDELRGELAAIKAADPGAKVVQTEPLAGYLLAEAGLDDITPAGLQDAVEAGQSPSAARRRRDPGPDRATVRRPCPDLQHPGRRRRHQSAARHRREGGCSRRRLSPRPSRRSTTDYIEWQRANVEALASALAAGASSTSR